MNRFYGWLHSEAARPSADLHVRMAATGRPQIVFDNPPCGLGVAGSLSAGSSACDASVGVVIRGRPVWRDADLERIAADAGHATALRVAYQRHGRKLLDTLAGSFALAIVDRDQRRVLLAIDRMGIEQLCYALTPRGTVFGRDVDTVAAHPDVDAALDLQSVYDYLYFHAVPSPQTIVRGVRKLEPGQFLDVADGRVTLDHYWRATFAEEATGSETKLAAELLALLEQAVREQAAGADTGAFLSGGIDSSTVAGLISRVGSRPARTFTIGFSAEGYDEMGYARISARHFGTEQHEYYLTADDVAAAVPRIAAHYDEPFGNSSAVPAYYCARMAHDRGVQLMLAGDGGDELFGGNSRYGRMNVFEWYHRVPGWLRGMIEPALLRGDPARGPLPVRKARSYVEQAKIPLPDRLQSYNYFSRTPARQILHPDLLAAVDLERPLAQLRSAFETPASRDPVNRMLFLDWKFALADNDLRKVGQMCELAGVEVRYPWLDDRVVELSMRLPGDWKVRGRQLRWFVKRALKDFLPAEVIHKPKHGFGLPFGVWMGTHTQLKQLAQDSLATLRRRDLVRPDYLEELQRRYREEHAPYFGEFIWVLMMLEQWLEARDVQGAAAVPRRRAVREQ